MDRKNNNRKQNNNDDGGNQWDQGRVSFAVFCCLILWGFVYW